MDSDDAESGKDKPIDACLRPALAESNKPCGATCDPTDQKSPFEKMLDEEKEKEMEKEKEKEKEKVDDNQLSDSVNYPFVLGSPTDESDGTILFNYEELSKSATDEIDDEFTTPSHTLDSDSTLNEALRRAIREQQDLDSNKRFMEEGSSGSSIDSGISAVDIEQPDLDLDKDMPFLSIPTDFDPVMPLHNAEAIVTMFEPRQGGTAADLQFTHMQSVDNAQNDENISSSVMSGQVPDSSTQNAIVTPAQHSSSGSNANTTDFLIVPTQVPSPGKFKKLNFIKRFFSSKKE